MLYVQSIQAVGQIKKELAKIEQELALLPEGRIVVSGQGKYTKWYKVDEEKQYVYLPKHCAAEAEQLAKKKYLQARKDALMQELTAINFYLRHHTEAISQTDQLFYDPRYAGLLRATMEPEAPDILEWANAPYERNTKYPEKLIHPTMKGDMVRSKSEAFIANSLYQKNIPYRYECALELDGIIYYPDFTILHPRTRKKWIYEHFGIMDNTSYAHNATNKIELYSSHGYIMNANFIATFETAEFPLDSVLVEELIELYFK